MNYWAVGSSWGGTQDKTQMYINDKNWFDGKAKSGNNEYENYLRKVSIGDILIMKSSATKGPNHSTAFTRLKAIGIVTKIIAFFEYEVDWIYKEQRDFDNIAYRKIIEPVRDDEMKNFCISFYNNLINQINMQEYITLLKSNKNLIFTGAPGTGKTYLAKEITRNIILKNENLENKIEKLILEKVIVGMKIKTRTGKEFEIKKNSDSEVSCSPLNSEQTYTLPYLKIIEYITSGKIYDKIDTSINGGNGSYFVGVGLYVNSHLFSSYTSFVQFHPSYDYTDFIEGLRPVKKDETLGFELKNGIFKAFCKKAKDNPNKNYVFIIDEINRAEISKVFGELMFSIDPGYRGINGAVATQYANIQEGDTIFDEELGEGKFYIPENVYIIGTMNDIDRSVESFDFALRRRFAWKEITAEDSQKMLEDKTWKDEAILKMNALNAAIENTNGLGAAYQIGAAYFLKLDNYNGDFTQLWNNHLQGILSEYLRGMPDAKNDLAKLENAYNNAQNNG